MQNWYYSTNGERQGPVSYEELKAIARSGRLQPDTDLAWTEGMADWKASGQIAGLFQDDAPAPSGIYNPYAAPTTPSENLLAPLTGTAEITPGSYQLDATGVIGRCIELTKRNFGLLFGIGFVYLLVGGLVEAGLNFLSTMISPPVAVPAPASGSVWEIALTQMAAQQSGASWGFQIISWIFSTFLALGLAKAALDVVTGKEISVGTLFSQGDKLWRTLGASILYGLMVALGILLLIVPGIYLALRFLPFQQAIIDRNLGVMESFRYSSELTKNNRFNLFLISLLCLLVVLAGLLALVVGLAFAIPVVTLAYAVAYRCLQYGHAALQDQPGTKRPLLQAICGSR